MNRPITGGSYDPLSRPSVGLDGSSANASAFRPGQFVQAIMDNTAFFKSRPQGEADADKLLPRGTSMKVISSGESHIKVELDSGEVGWVPVLMVEDPKALPNPGGVFGAAQPGEYQVYPPTGGFGGELPPVAPGEMPPEGAIPTLIDPEAPGNPQAVPPATVPQDTFPTPVPLPPPATPSEPPPLPPPAGQQN
jgi:hypothetical protein